MQRLDSRVYTYSFSIPAGQFEIVDFQDNIQALEDRPFNAIRISNPSYADLEIDLDGNKYYVPANSFMSFEQGDIVFYTVKIKNLHSTETAAVKIEVRRIKSKTEHLAEKLLKVFGI